MGNDLKIKAGFGAAFALFLGVGIAAVVQTYAWEASVAWMAHTFEVIGHLDAAVRLSRDLDVLARARALDFTAGAGEYSAGLNSLAAHVAEIVRLTSDNSFEAANSQLLQRFTADRGVPFRMPATDASRARYAALLDTMQAEEHRLLRIRIERQGQIAARARRLFMTATFFSFLMTLLAARRASGDGRRRTVAEKALTAREEQYRQVVEMAGDMIFRADRFGRFTFCNETALNMLHLTEGEVIGRSYLKLIRPDKRKQVERCYIRQFARRCKQTYSEFPLIDGHGRERWIGQNVQLLLQEGEVAGFQGIARDITDRKRGELELAKSRGFVEKIAATTPGILYVYHLDERRNVYSNREVISVLGYKPEEMDRFLGEPSLLYHAEDLPALRRHHDSLRHALDGEVGRIEYRARHAAGHWVWLAARDTPFERSQQGVVTLIVGIAQDITVRKAAQERLAYQANYDALTGLANRHFFSTRLQSVLRRAGLDNGVASVCVLDLDRFKETNDRFGHAAGDEVLEAIGNIMRSELRANDLAGRLGGDEFSFVLPEADLEEASRIAERIRDRLSALEFGLKSQAGSFAVTATFGVAEWQPNMDARELLENADRALYRAKSSGRNRVCAAA